MYSTILSQRTSLLSAPTLNPINWSGACSAPAAVRAPDATSSDARTRPVRTARRGRVRGRSGHGVSISMSKDRPAFMSETTVPTRFSRLPSRELVARPATRMAAIQAPIVAVIGDFIRQVPGTISLGQGVVHYGPPREAIDAVAAALSEPRTHQYHDGAGLPELIDCIAAKLAAENGIDATRGSRIMVTAGANMAFVHAVLATTS